MKHSQLKLFVVSLLLIFMLAGCGKSDYERFPAKQYSDGISFCKAELIPALTGENKPSELFPYADHIDGVWHTDYTDENLTIALKDINDKEFQDYILEHVEDKSSVRFIAVGEAQHTDYESIRKELHSEDSFAYGYVCGSGHNELDPFVTIEVYTKDGYEKIADKILKIYGAAVVIEYTDSYGSTAAGAN